VADETAASSELDSDDESERQDAKAVTIWHNPECDLSVYALELLEELSDDITVIEYLKDVPTVEEILRVGHLMAKSIRGAAVGSSPRSMLRKAEPLYRELDMRDPSRTDEEIACIMNENPMLIQRPIAFTETAAIVARPSQLVNALFIPALPDELPPGFPRGLELPKYG